MKGKVFEVKPSCGHVIYTSKDFKSGSLVTIPNLGRVIVEKVWIVEGKTYCGECMTKHMDGVAEL